MLDDRFDYLWFHTKVAMAWLIIGVAVGATLCFYVMKDATRPVVEVRVDPRGTTTTATNQIP